VSPSASRAEAICSKRSDPQRPRAARCLRADPGKPLGKYTVRRILKTDGTKKVKKWKT